MIKKVTVIILCFTAAIAHAQQGSDNSFVLGTKTLYGPLSCKYTDVPKGYNAVFINHVGRHGARHLTKDVNTYYLFSVINRADSLKLLTTKGEQLKNKILLLNKIETGKVKSISYEGKAELQQIASRFFANNKTVFNNNTNINLRYTREKRTLESAEAFMQGVKEKTFIQSFQQKEDNEGLRFYDLSAAYTNYKKKGNWTDSLAKLKAMINYEQLTHIICTRFFNEVFLTGYKIDEEEIVSDIFGFATIVYSLKSEMKEANITWEDADFASLLLPDELKYLSQIDEAEEYFAKGPATDITGIQIKIAVPLLIDFINTTDDFIQSKRTNVQIRFCHAETIIPFAAIMNIANTATVAKNVSEINIVWHAESIAPLSANIQWILYYNPITRDYLIKFLLNEKEVAISELQSKTFPYYKWNDVKAYYLNKLHLLNADLNTNALKYLQSLK